jgi:MFS family permease
MMQAIGFNEARFGLFISLVGVGSVIGSLLFGQFTFWKERPLTVMASSFVGTGTIIGLMGVAATGMIALPTPLWFMLSFLVGGLSCMQHIPYGYLLQIHTPATKMGRVSSVAQSVQTCMMLIAPVLGAILAKQIGVGIVFVLAGVLCFLNSIIVLLYTRSKQLEVKRVISQ